MAGRLQSKFEKVICRLRRRCGKHSTPGRGNMHTAIWLEYLWVGQRMVIVVWIEACKVCVWPLHLWPHLILQYRNVCCADLQCIYIFILYLLRIFCQTGIIIVHIPLFGIMYFRGLLCSLIYSPSIIIKLLVNNQLLTKTASSCKFVYITRRNSKQRKYADLKAKWQDGV